MNYIKIIGITYRILLGIYWSIIAGLCILLVFLVANYYNNHYSDPDKSRLQEYIWQAVTLNQSSQTQDILIKCLQNQNTKEKYPSQIMQECLSKARSMGN